MKRRAVKGIASLLIVILTTGMFPLSAFSEEPIPYEEGYFEDAGYNDESAENVWVETDSAQVYAAEYDDAAADIPEAVYDAEVASEEENHVQAEEDSYVPEEYADPAEAQPAETVVEENTDPTESVDELRDEAADTADNAADLSDAAESVVPEETAAEEATVQPQEESAGLKEENSEQPEVPDTQDAAVTEDADGATSEQPADAESEETAEDTEAEEDTDAQAEDTEAEEDTDAQAEDTEADEDTDAQAEDAEAEEDTDAQAEDTEAEEDTDAQAEDAEAEEDTDAQAEDTEAEEDTDAQAEDAEAEEDTDAQTEESEDAEEEEEADGESTIQIVTLSREDAADIVITAANIPEGGELVIVDAREEDYLNALNEQIKEETGAEETEDLVYDRILALDISIQGAELAEPVLLTINAPELAEISDAARLYHVNHSGQTEVVEYTKNLEETSISFASTEFSPFILVDNVEEPMLMAAAVQGPAILVDTFDVYNNYVDSSVINYTLSYYEMPLSVMEAMTAKAPTEDAYGSRLAYLQAMKNYNDQVQAELAPYQQTVDITGQSQKIGDLRMEPEATAENPYVIFFQVGMELEVPSDDVITYADPYQYFVPTAWIGIGFVQYDGTSVTAHPGLSEDADGRLHVIIYHDDSLVTPSVSITLDTELYEAITENDPAAYPVYAKAILRGKGLTVSLIRDSAYANYTSFPQSATQEVSADGTVTFTFARPVSSFQRFQGDELMVMFFEDEACTQPISDWEMVSGYSIPPYYSSNDNQMHHFFTLVGADGSVQLYNFQTGSTAGTCSPVFRKQADKVKPKFSIAAMDVAGNAPADAYPFYAQVILTDQSTGESQTKVVPITGPYTADDEGLPMNPDQYQFEEEVAFDHSFRLEIVAFADEACEQPLDEWAPLNYWKGLSYDNAYYSPEKQAWFYGGQQLPALMVSYQYGDVTIETDAYTNDTAEDYPVYLKAAISAWVYKNNQWTDEIVGSQVIPVTENGSQDIVLQHVPINTIYVPNFVNWVSLDYDVYQDEECTELAEGWNKTPVYNSLKIWQDGKLYYSFNDPDMTPSNALGVLSIERVQWSSVSVPMTAEIGSFEESDFFPVYLSAALTDTSTGTTVVVDKSLSALSDANGELVFALEDGQKFPVALDGSYDLSWNFYQDADHTTPASNWSGGSVACALTSNGLLMLQNGSSLGLHFLTPHVTVEPQAREQDIQIDEENPIYVRVDARASQTDFSDTLYWKGTRTNLEAFEAEFPWMAYVFSDPDQTEQWFAGCFVTDESYVQLADGWKPDPYVADGGPYQTWLSTDGSMQVLKQTITTRDRYGNEITETVLGDLTLRPEYNPSGVDAELPVHVNVPEDIPDPYLLKTMNYMEALHIILTHQEADGSVTYYGSDWDNYSSLYIPVDDLDDQNSGSYTFRMIRPGEYQLVWYMGTDSEYRNGQHDPFWMEPEEPVTVTIDENGNFLDENGDPYTLEVLYKEEFRHLTSPVLDVITTYPDGFRPTYYYMYANDDRNPYGFRFTLTPLWDGADAADTVSKYVCFRYYTSSLFVPEGASKIGSPQDFYDYISSFARNTARPDGTPAIQSLYSQESHEIQDVSKYYGWPRFYWSDTMSDTWGRSYTADYRNYSYFYGLPVGDYELSYGVTQQKYNDDQLVNLSSWTRDTVKLHLSEDGHFYLIGEDGIASEPYVMDIHYIEEEDRVPDQSFDTLKVQVQTTLQDGITAGQAFQLGDTFQALLLQYTDYDETNYQENFIPVAIGEAQITEAGLSDLTLRPVEGETIGLFDDKEYYVFIGTYENSDGTDPLDWKNLNWSPNWIYYNYANVKADDEGNLLYLKEWNSAPQPEDYTTLVLDNKSLLLPWKVTNPGSVSQYDGEDAITFKPVTEITQFQDTSHYMIVTQNTFDGNWYALAYDENGGHQVLLSDVSSIDDLKNGYKISENGDNIGSYILTASKVKQAEDSVELQLRTSIKDSAGKYISVKLGSSAANVEPLLSNSAGTVIIRNKSGSYDAPTYQMWKGSYANLRYISELYGQSGFSSQGYRVNGNGLTPKLTRTYREGGVYDLLNQVYLGRKPQAEYPYTYGQNFLYLLDERYTQDAYLEQFTAYFRSQRNIPVSTWDEVEIPYTKDFYILTDNEDDNPSVENNTYILVKTFGDFYNTFVEQGGVSASMLLVYADGDGKTYAFNPKGLTEVSAKPGTNGYDKIVAGADNEVIPNNHSGTSSTFNIVETDVVGNLEQVFATGYAFRKSRMNNAENAEYLTLGATAWTKSDDTSGTAGVIYVLHPQTTIHSQADWDEVESYKLSVIRYGETSWLGVADGQLVTVGSEGEAAAFTVYSPTISRYYSSAYGSDLYKYYRVYKPEDINAGDEILVVYNDGEQRYVLAYDFTESVYGNYGAAYAIPALQVLQSGDTIDTRDDFFPTDTRYQYRLNTEGYVKKPYAYLDGENADLIWAQGVASNAIGNAKTEKKDQRKYDSVIPLGRQLQRMYIKDGATLVYTQSSAEVNFFPAEEEGLFYIRGGKATAWLGTNTYTTSQLNLSTGAYVASNPHLTFTTVGTDQRIAVEIYRKSAADTFDVEYYTPEQELIRTETKTTDSIVLPQDEDVTKDGTNYIFVGWTADPEKSGYLSFADSANLFDYEDLAKLAAVKPAVKEQYQLLGDCDPDKDNRVVFADVEPYVEDHILKLYPVYAVRGFDQCVTANDGSTMIIGVTDSKDLQMGGDGQISSKERWLGSIEIQVYKDGELWVSSDGQTSRSFSNKRVRFAPSANGGSGALYFAYHNDDAVDLNIKFIAESVTEEMLTEYLKNTEFTAAEPTERYVIDAVYAEQGGSEDGLKYRLNWMDPIVGGQLDNVKGGSIVKVYVTTKYQVKYFLDTDDGNGYQELTGDPWENENYYTTDGTEKTVNALKESVDYVVTHGGAYTDLIDPTPSMMATFLDENIRRGEYSQFLYKFEEYEHVIPIAQLPEDLVPEDRELDSDQWALRVKDLEKKLDVEPSSDWTVTGTSYGTGNTVYAYKNKTDYNDVTNTYHLYAKVKPYEATGTFTPGALKKLEGRKLEKEEFRFELLDADGTVLQTAKNEADGTVTFAEITYTLDDIPESGTISYQIREAAGDDTSVTYDNKVYTVTVTLEDQGDGTISVTPSMEAAKVIFTNTVEEETTSEEETTTTPEETTSEEETTTTPEETTSEEETTTTPEETTSEEETTTTPEETTSEEETTTTPEETTSEEETTTTPEETTSEEETTTTPEETTVPEETTTTPEETTVPEETTTTPEETTVPEETTTTPEETTVPEETTTTPEETTVPEETTTTPEETTVPEETTTTPEETTVPEETTTTTPEETITTTPEETTTTTPEETTTTTPEETTTTTPEETTTTTVAPSTAPTTTTPDSPTQPTRAGENPPKTGDENNLLLWIVILIAALCILAAAGLFLIRSRRQK